MAVVVWSKPQCPQCDKAKALLAQKNIEFEERKIGKEYAVEDLLKVAPAARSVPQIFINDQLVGGYKELVSYIENTNFNNTGHTL